MESDCKSKEQAVNQECAVHNESSDLSLCPERLQHGVIAVTSNKDPLNPFGGVAVPPVATRGGDRHPHTCVSVPRSRERREAPAPARPCRPPPQTSSARRQRADTYPECNPPPRPSLPLPSRSGRRDSPT